MTDSPDMDLVVTAADKPDQITRPPAKEVHTATSIFSSWRRVPWTMISLFRVSLFLLTLAITLMKEGERALRFLVQTAFAAGSNYRSC